MNQLSAVGLASLMAGCVASMSSPVRAEWQVGEVRSHVEGTLGRGMWTKAVGARWRNYDVDLTLAVQCVKNSTTVLLYSERSMIGSSENTVAWSVDGGAVQRGQWDRTSDYSGVGLWHGTGIPFAKSLVGAALLKVSIIPANGAQTDATFIVANAEAGLKEVGRQCGWQPPEAKKAVVAEVPKTWATVLDGSKFEPTKDGYVWRSGTRIGWVDQKALIYYRIDQLESRGDAPRPFKGAIGERFSAGALEAAVEKTEPASGKQALDSSAAKKSQTFQQLEKTADGYVWSSGRRLGWVDDKTSTYFRVDQVSVSGGDRPTPRSGIVGVKVIGGNLNEAVRQAEVDPR